MTPELISSLQNPRVKNLVKLRRESKIRKRQQQFLIEGKRELERALKSSFQIETIYLSEKAYAEIPESSPILSLPGISLTLLSEAAFKKCAYRENPDGVLAVGKIPSLELSTLKISDPALIVIAESIEKPGNLGTLLRTADAVGADALIITEPLVDIFNPNTIRASQGAIFHVPFCITNNADVAAWLKEKNIQAIVTTPHTDTRYWDLDLRKPTAIIMGSEAYGLSPFWLKSQTISVQPALIPMSGMSDSLNISASAAIVLFEAKRQRNQKSS